MDSVIRNEMIEYIKKKTPKLLFNNSKKGKNKTKATEENMKHF